MLRLKQDLLSIFNKSVKRVLPLNILKEKIKFENRELLIKGKSFYVDHNIHVIGFGKAVYSMGKFIENLLGDHIVSGVLSVPVNTLNSLNPDEKLDQASKIEVLEGARNNLPDHKAQQNASRILDLVSALCKRDILLVLISGGGSALLPLPIPPITIKEKSELVKQLSESGATIQEINSVRKRISQVKGGKLALHSTPATVINIVLSDIVEDPLDLIAGGPTAYNPDDAQMAHQILSKYKLEKQLPASVIEILANKPKASVMEDFDHVFNVLIGNNTLAVETAVEEAKNLGYESLALTSSLTGVARMIGEKIANLIQILNEMLFEENVAIGKLQGSISALKIIPEKTLEALMMLIRFVKKEKKKLCLVFGGETVVKVIGTGSGGRNQELALACAINSSFSIGRENWMILSAGTDGVDGPTDAAGAFTYKSQIREAKNEGIVNIDTFLENNDSHSFYKLLKNGDDLLVTGLTGTNVMDLVIIVIQNKEKM